MSNKGNIEKLVELKIELLQYLVKNTIMIDSNYKPNYKSKKYTNEEIEACLESLSKDNLVHRKGTITPIFADLSDKGEMYLDYLINKKKQNSFCGIIKRIGLSFIAFLGVLASIATILALVITIIDRIAK